MGNIINYSGRFEYILYIHVVHCLIQQVSLVDFYTNSLNPLEKLTQTFIELLENLHKLVRY